MSLRFPCAWHRLDWPSKAVGHSRVISDLLQTCLTFCIFPLPDYPDPDNFTWEKYLKETGASAVPAWAFKVVSVIICSTPPGKEFGFSSLLGLCLCDKSSDVLYSPATGPRLWIYTQGSEVRAVLGK